MFILFTFWVLTSFGASSQSGKLADIAAAQKKSLQQSIQNWKIFTADKDVMGRAQGPDGSPGDNTQKGNFNQDDKGSYRSRFTYHDEQDEKDDAIAAKKNEQIRKANPNTPDSKLNLEEDKLPLGVSEHGALDGDSSELEQKAYRINQKYSKAQRKKSFQEREEEEKKLGYRSQGMFNIQTVEIKQGTNPDGSPKKVPVSRATVNEEAKKEFEQVGDAGAQSIDLAAKQAGGGDGGNNTMGKLDYYYEAANRALKAFWNSTAANLGQRRFAKNRSELGFDSDITLSESTPDCDKAVAAATQQLNQNKNMSDKQRQEALKKLEEAKGRCFQLAQTSYKDINPTFETPKPSPGSQSPQAGPQLKMKGPEGEDRYEREYRGQLFLMGNVSKGIQDFKSEWQYQAKDEKSQVADGLDANGNPVLKEMTMREQVDARNQRMDQAVKNMDKVKALGLKVDIDQDSRYLDPNQSAMEITKMPEKAKYEGWEYVAPQETKYTPPETYEGLLKSKD